MLGKFSNLLIIQSIVIFIELVVQFPEFTLFIGSQGGDSSRPGEFVVSEWKVLEYNFHFVFILLEHLFEYRRKPSAVRSLEITEDSYFHRRINSTLEGGVTDIEVLDKSKKKNLNSLVLATTKKKYVFFWTNFNTIYVFAN